mmetsp:Transcript_113648/g.197472  ORF Transcript_113648/g.197472 Transcript_113648/m.197472 type:complete len:90 (+) Transcript_113648:142-411(+)
MPQVEQILLKGFNTVYTDGSAKLLKGFSQVGYGCWYGHNELGNFHAYVPPSERQSNNRAELRAILHALQKKASRQQLCVILDAKMLHMS